MSSSYYSPGEREKDKALQGMLAWAAKQKAEGKNFFGQPLEKVDPSKGKGAVTQATVTKAKQMPVGGAMGRGSQLVQKQRLAQEALKADLITPAVTAAREVGAMEALATVNPGSKGMGMTTGLGAAKDVTVTGLDAASKAQNALKIKDAATLSQAGTAAASTGTLQAAASSAMPYLLAAQLVLGFLGSKDDEEGWLGIRPSGNPWGAAGAGGTGVVG